MAWYDYVPGVGQAVRGAKAVKAVVEGDKQAAADNALRAVSPAGAQVHDIAERSTGKQGADALVAAGQGIGDFVGVTNTPTGALDQDLAAARKQRDATTAALANTTPGVAPTVRTTTIAPTERATGATVAQGPHVNAATVGTAPVVNAPTVTRTGGIEGMQVKSPVVATTGNAYAQRVTAPTIQRVGPVAAAEIDPAAQAAAERATAAEISPAANEFRAGQARLITMLEEGAAGKGPSAAELIAQRTAEAGARRQLGLAATKATGGNVGLALREAGQNIAAIEADASQNAAILKQQEQLESRKQLIGALEGTRGQDIGLATTEAGFRQQTGLQNAELGTRTNLANTEALNRRSLTQAGFEQEAAQADANREQAVNLEQGRTDLAAGTSNAELGTRVSESNAEREARRASQQAQLDSDATLANQRTDLSAKTTSAEIASRENLSEAELRTKVAVENAQNELNVLLTQAKLNQEAGIVDAQLQQQINLKQAELDQRTSEFNAEAANQRALEQGRITAGEADTDLEATLKQRQLDLEREEMLRQDLARQGELAIRGEEAKLGITQKDKERRQKFIGDVAGAGGEAVSAIGVASDPRGKADITRLLQDDQQIDDFLDALDAYSFRYKDPEAPGAAAGKRVGVMTTDLKKSAIGRSLVEETPRGEVINIPQAVGVLLATLAKTRDEMARKKGRR